ncbi:MAG TPA: hypothetical protein PKI19_07270 [Elusimicrobiales bacterium]|nr:hypothetical protein [Elusimicrobiales bacterium]
MALKFNCSKCGGEITVKYLHAGETARCRKCGADNAVPRTAPEISEEQAEEYLKNSASRAEQPALPPDSCAACKYFGDSEDDAGKCHRYPPADGEYPLVTGLDWCGEHKDRT